MGFDSMGGADGVTTVTAMSSERFILRVARVSPALPRGLWILAFYWVLIATGGGFVAQRALATVGNTPRGVVIAVVAGAILLITALYSIRVRRMVWELVQQRRRHNAVLKRAAINASGANAGEREDDPEENTKLYEAILAAEAGSVPGPKRIAELERMYGVSLPRVWVIRPKAVAGGGVRKRASAPREVEGGKATTDIERCLSEPGENLLTVVLIGGWALTVALMVLFAVMVPMRGAGNFVRVGFWVMAAAGFAGPVVWATMFGNYWSMRLHERGVTLVRRGWPRSRVLETVEVELGRDVVVMTIGSGGGVAVSGAPLDWARVGQVRMGVHLAERDLRVWGGPVELPEGMVWRVLGGEKMVKF